ncbi:MAG TPA: hypothetical protein VMT61_17540 [Candidatus Binataceae bacterium]|nr:hypothetical protein [Candidatus Binataceae bacterium]
MMGLGSRRIVTTKLAGIVLVAAALISIGGCAETFGDKLHDHRNCIAKANIEPDKVDTCLRNTDGHRDRMDLCLNDEMVAESKIQRLDECVESYPGRNDH